MTQASDEAGLLAAISAHPEEDTPRLVYADWLDENPVALQCPMCALAEPDEGHESHPADIACVSCGGTERLTSSANERRAEFIRVQCAIGRHPRDSETCLCGYEPMDGYHHNNPTCPFVRSDALLASHGRAWCRVPCVACRGAGDDGGHHYDRGLVGECNFCRGTGDAKLTWERGFVSAVGCPRLEDVVGPQQKRKVCPDCVHWKGRVPKDCRCGGTRRIDAVEAGPTPWALAVAAQCPTVREFRAADREPGRAGKGFWYLEEYAPGGPRVSDPWCIPALVFDALDGFTGSSRRDGGRDDGTGARQKHYPTRGAALTALYCGLARVVRRHAQQSTSGASE